MNVELTAFVVVITLASITGLTLAWHLRFQILGLAILIGCAWLLFTSDIFLVIRIPILCVVSFGILLIAFTFIPRSSHKNQQNHTH